MSLRVLNLKTYSINWNINRFTLHIRKLSCGGPFFPATSHQSHTSMHPSINHVQVVAYLKYLQHELCELTPNKYNIKFSQSSFLCNAEKVWKHFLVFNFILLDFKFIFVGPMSIPFARIREESRGAIQSEASTRLLKISTLTLFS